jgi:nicotinamidase-related amidase
MLTTDNTALIIIDVQEKLFKVMLHKEALAENLQKIIKGAQVLEIPLLVTEQNPIALGPTIPELKNFLPNIQPISKLSFSCCGEQKFLNKLSALNCKKLLLAGIEAHICVYQTALELLEKGYDVQVLADCVSSRTEENKKLGLERIKEAGGSVTSVEIALFELMRIAEGGTFKEISKIVK